MVNHFTRIETLLMPAFLYNLTRVPIWSLADSKLFRGSLAGYLESVGAISTEAPDRDRLIIKSLLTGEAAWIIFPEGRMVKDKKLISKGRYMVYHREGLRPPHTGAATLALRTEFYRQRLRELTRTDPGMLKDALNLLGIESVEPVLKARTYIVPVNITYYPIRSRENILSQLAERFVEDLSERALEEIMTEGSMLLSGVDVDIRFGKAIPIRGYAGNIAAEEKIRPHTVLHLDNWLPPKWVMREKAVRLMERYMSDIYGMTTVNHDHLFASILRMFPFKKMSEADLRRRVYLCTGKGLEKPGISLHESLKSDQSHLLVDDRFHQYANFVSVALDTGIIVRKGKALVKDMVRFSHPFDFHRFRLDNPIAMIANEVEPLKDLQRHLLFQSLWPSFWVRRKLVRHLLKKGVTDFYSDYKAFYREGESKKKAVGLPFLIKGGMKKIGVLLIHGYMAAPMEVRGLAEYLSNKGFWVYAPRLKGHGTSPEDLANRTYQDWRASVDEGYALLSSICSKVIVGGFSTGAGLALDLAIRAPRIAGVFTVCSPLRLKYLSGRFTPAVNVWNRLMEKIRVEGARKDYVTVIPENPHINYSRNPVSGVREVERLMSGVEARLAELTIPALVLQSLNDPIVDHRGSLKLFELLGSKDKSYLLLDDDRHVIIVGKGSERVHRAIGDFVSAWSRGRLINDHCGRIQHGRGRFRLDDSPLEGFDQDSSFLREQLNGGVEQFFHRRKDRGESVGGVRFFSMGGDRKPGPKTLFPAQGFEILEYVLGGVVEGSPSMRIMAGVKIPGRQDPTSVP